MDGPLGLRPLAAAPNALDGDEPSRDGARGAAGAVYRLLSSDDQLDEPVLGNGYPEPPAKMPLVVLVRLLAGESTGEK